MKYIEGHIDISSLILTELPDLHDVIVKGNFYCSNNKLINLIGCPMEVHGNFSCGRNNLLSFEGSPKIVKGDFNCGSNKATNLIFTFNN